MLRPLLRLLRATAARERRGEAATVSAAVARLVGERGREGERENAKGEWTAAKESSLLFSRSSGECRAKE
jgi:hypothetical protein